MTLFVKNNPGQLKMLPELRMPHKRKTRKKLTLWKKLKNKEEKPEKVVENEEHKQDEETEAVTEKTEPVHEEIMTLMILNFLRLIIQDIPSMSWLRH